MEFNNGYLEEIQERCDMPWWPGTSSDSLESPQDTRLT